MPVLDWFDDWLDRHMQRLPRADWPDFGAEYWDAWIKRFEALAVAEPDADGASVRLAADPPPFLSDQLPRLLAGIESARREREAETLRDRRRRAAELHREQCDLIDRQRRLWESLPESERTAIRAQVDREFPAARCAARFYERLCIEMMGAECPAGSGL